MLRVTVELPRGNPGEKKSERVSFPGLEHRRSRKLTAFGTGLSTGIQAGGNVRLAWPG